MAKLERMYNVPLRSEFQKVPSHRKAKKAVKALAEFIARHMHAEFENVRITTELNNFIWKHGMKNPPHHIKVNAVKEDNGMVMVELAEKKPEKRERPAKVMRTKGSQHPENAEAFSMEKKAKVEKKAEAKKEDHTGHKHEEKKAEHKKEEKPKSEHKPAAKKSEKK